VVDGRLTETRFDEEASHRQVEAPVAVQAQPAIHQAEPKDQLEQIEDFLGTKVIAATQEVEVTNVAAKRAAFLEAQEQHNAPANMLVSKDRSIALARKMASHAAMRADVLAAADGITGDRVIVLQTIVKIVQNAHKDIKCSSVKSSSKTLQEKVLNLGGGPLLMAAGFKNCGETWELSSEASAEHVQTLLGVLEAAQKPPPSEVTQEEHAYVDADGVLACTSVNTTSARGSNDQ